MRSVFCYLLVCSSLFGSNLESLTEFSIYQDPCMRLFHVTSQSQVLATILNSDWGRFDFYDQERKKRWTNLENSLLDEAGNQVGQLVWHVDPETKKWFWERERWSYTQMSYIDLYAGDGKELLLTFHPFYEGNRELCVFSDGETKNTLAIAYWFWTPDKTRWCSCLYPKIQNWQVYIIDQPRLHQRAIPHTFLIWVLLKHSQDHFPFGSSQYDYVKELPH